MDDNLPQYRCSRLVHAFKIGQVVADRISGGSILVPEDPTLPDRIVTPEYVSINRPTPGGYFLIEGNGYETYRTATAFEQEYFKVSE